MGITLSQQNLIEIGADLGNKVNAWNSAFLLNDGTFVNWCIGDHDQFATNEVRGFNPSRYTIHDSSNTDRAAGTGYYRATNTSPSNTYQNDNLCHLYIPSEDVIVTLGLDANIGGVFDLASNAWIYGNRSPLDTDYKWTNYVGGDIEEWESVWPYNPIAKWMPSLDIGVVLGGAPSGDENSGGSPYFYIIEATTNGDGVYPIPWKITQYAKPSAVTFPCNARNNCVVIGSDLYFGGGSITGPARSNLFFKMDFTDPDQPSTTALADWPDTFEAPWSSQFNEYLTLLVYDSKRNRLVLIGWNVYAYNIGDNSWSNITPVHWRPITFPMGDYVPAMDAIIYRGGSEIWPDHTPTGPGNNQARYKKDDDSVPSWTGADSCKWWMLRV